MEAAMNLLSSFPSRTHFRNTPLSASVSMLHEQTSAIPSLPTASLCRQFPSSVLSHEPHDECSPSFPIIKEDKTLQIQDGAVVQDDAGTSDKQLGDFKDQLFHWSDLIYLLSSVENAKRPPSTTADNHKPSIANSCDVISLAQEALSASKQAQSLAESCDISGSDFDGPLSPRVKDSSTVKQTRVMSTRLLERRTKRRKSSKPKTMDETGSSKKTESRKLNQGFDPNDPLRLFLWGPETKQLLTVQEENELIREIQGYNRLVDVRRRLQSEFEREPTFSEWADAVGLSAKALRLEVHFCERSREKLIYANFRMVVHIAKQYQGRGLSFQDLLQEGSMGLMKSVEKFKPQAGCRFPSYAYWWIRQSIRKAIFQHSRTIRLPENMYSLLSKVLEARKLYIQEGHHNPTMEEVARRVGITVEKLQNLLFLMRNPLSMQQAVWKDQDTTFQEVTPDDGIESPDVCVERQLMRKHIRSLLGTLTPREQQIIKLRYGIGSGSGKQSSLSEIGTIFELSKERVRQIETRALLKLKQSLKSHGLEAYTDLLV